MPCKGSILTEWNGGPARPVSVLTAGARPATAWAAGARPVSEWAGCEIASLLSITPNTGARASSVFVILSGANFAPASTLVISGFGVVATDVIYGGSDILVATFVIDGAADLGDHDVQVDDGTGTLTGALPFTVTAAAWPSATAPKIWLEADYGINVADDDLVSVAGDWNDRGPNGLDPFVGATKGAPRYREQGFGGQGLPFIKFDNAQGLTTAQSAALNPTTSTTFIVGMRNSADANSCIIFEFSAVCLALGIQNAAASWYCGRPNTILPIVPTQILESSYNSAFGHIPLNSRFILRHQFKGSHAENKMFLNGVQTILATQLNNGIGQNPPGPCELRIGYRDPSLPGLDLDGQIAAILQYSPALSDAETAQVELYLQKWLATVPMASAGRGPILLASENFGGLVTVTVNNWAVGDGATYFGSAPSVGATYVILRFSQPIRRFGFTNPFDTYPNSRLMVACDDIDTAGTIVGAHDAKVLTSAGQREYVRYDAGFDTVIIRDTISNFHTSGVVENARFWLVGEF